MTTEKRAVRWKMQNSKMGSRKLTTNLCVRKTAADITSMTIAVVRHDTASLATLLDKVSHENGGRSSIKGDQKCLDVMRWLRAMS